VAAMQKEIKQLRKRPAGGSGAGGAETRAVEFCGGTHLERTAQVCVFKILSEESVAKGVRRITAVTGRAAVERFAETERAVKALSTALKVPPEELPDRMAAMQKEIKQLRKRPAGGAAGGEGLRAETVLETPQGRVLVGRMGPSDPAALRAECDRQRQKGAAATFLGAVGDGKVLLVAMVSEALAARGKVKAGEWVRAVAPTVGGGGGGKDTLAQAGGKQAEKLDEALRMAAEWVRERMG